MRDYTRKAKRVDNGKWIIGYLVSCDERYFISEVPECDTCKYMYEGYWFGTFYEVDPDTICNPTGLTDKNGNKIWENDVIGYLDTYSTENGLAEADCIGKVFWDDETLSFQVTERLSAESYEVMDECSVIGNIFDNPDLLKGGIA